MRLKKYINSVKTIEEYNAFKNSIDYVLPNVSLVESENLLKFNNQSLNIQLYDILYEDTNGRIKITPEILDVSEGYVPIGLCVIPEGFFGVGEKARFMSLKYMTWSVDGNNNVVGGSSLTNQGMTWDETSVYTPKTSVYTQEQLNTSAWKSDWTNINYSWPDISQLTNKTRASASFDWGYLPSDNFSNMYNSILSDATNTPYNTSGVTGGLNSYYWSDSTRGWHNDALTNNRPLANLYQQDGSWLGGTTEVDTNHALYQINGKENSESIVNAYANALPNSEGKVTYLNRPTFQSRLAELKPFFVCSEYYTNVTQKGDWYLPACGELAMVIPNLKGIRQKLALINSVYSSNCMSSLVSASYWSSTEYSWNDAWRVNTGNGIVYCISKDNQRSVVAFLQH